MQASNNSLEKAVIPVSQCRGEEVVPLWPLAWELVSTVGGETGSSEAGLGICTATPLLFLDQLLVCCGGEASQWALAVRRAPEFTARPLSGQV